MMKVQKRDKRSDLKTFYESGGTRRVQRKERLRSGARKEG